MRGRAESILRSALRPVRAATLPGSLLLKKLLGKVSVFADKDFEDNIYTRLGVRPVINARGTWTYLTGSLELPAVRAAAEEASKYFVDLYELQQAVGRRLAELSGAESGIVTSGAAAAMATATAACMAGTDPKKIWQLPDTTGMKGEVVMFGGRTPFDSAIRLTGAKLVTAGTHEELEAALSKNTAMVYTTRDHETLEKALAVTKAAEVPILVDRAASIPPIENLSRFARMGADLYCFSGGKGLGGPQCSGLLLGRKDLIEAALANSSPCEGAVCRPMKVGKEEILGCLAAVETWSRHDVRELEREWRCRVERVKKLAESVPGVDGVIEVPRDDNRHPTLTVSWDHAAFGLTVAECAAQLREGTPSIEVLTNRNPSLVAAAREEGLDPGSEPVDRLRIVSATLQPGEDRIVGRRLRDVLLGARRRAKQRLQRRSGP